MSSGTPRQTPSSSSRHRRENNASVSSVSSRGSERGSSGRQPAHNPAVESAVTRLLVSIKQLLQALTNWSNMKMSEEGVSDVYVRLGNDFNAAVAAFGSFNIDMSELLSVPDELREILENCLAEDATPQNLEIYLPKVREIITNLLQGLRNKQSIYRKTVADAPSRNDGVERTSTRSSRSDRAARQDSAPSAGSPRMRAAHDNEGTSTPADSRRRATASSQDSSDGRSMNTRRQEAAGTLERSSTPRARPNRDSPPTNGGHTRSRNVSAFDDDDEPAPPRSRTPGPPTEPPSVPLPSSPPVPSSPPLQAPPEMKRYSLMDKPMPTPTVVVNDSSQSFADGSQSPPLTNGRPTSPTPSAPEASTPMETLQAPAVASSLAALKNSDVLERRASKRFSTYNISKMTGVRERAPAAPGMNRKSVIAGGSALATGDLHVLPEADEDEEEGEGAGAQAATVPPASFSSPRKVRRTDSGSRNARRPAPEEPVPPLPSVAIPSASDEAPPTMDAQPSTFAVPVPGPMSIFLQVGQEVKKVTVDPNPSFAALRMLFLDRFAYNPGKDNFPHIYIRDPSSSVMYELEDTSEIQRGSLLSLNIEALDQIKQHIDSQMSNLTQEIKDLRTMVASSRRASYNPPITVPIIRTESETTVRARPTEQEFQRVARRLSRVVNGTISEPPPIEPQMTGTTLQPQFTGGSVTSEASNRIILDLKSQFDEVQNLRRDLGVMRQLYTQFMSTTKDSLGQLRTQTQNVRELANAKVGGARAYIDSGKTTLDSRSQDVLTRVEELQDVVENLKDDVTKRQITPTASVIRKLKADMASVSAELNSLKEQITTVKPMWKKTWEEELQNIVEEQQFLHHQEEFLADLLEDYKALDEVYGHIEKIISIRGASGGSHKGRGVFRPPPLDEGHGGLSTVMMEIRGAQVDPERRMKAIEANQKIRQKELSGRPDEFQQELSGFVQGKKLKLTGGAEEAERVRQRKAEASLKAMFVQNTGGSFSPTEESGTFNDNGAGGGGGGGGAGSGDLMSGLTFDTM